MVNGQLSAGFWGTSASAPFVSGLAAWLLQVNPSLTAEDIVQTLERTATDMGPPGFDVFFGNGRIDGARATAYVTSPNWVEHGELRLGPGGLQLLGDSATTTLTLIHANSDVPGLADGTYSCVRYHLRGTAQLHGGFSTPPTAWVRRVSTWGTQANGLWDCVVHAPWGGVVGNPTATQVELETYVYRLIGASAQFYPTPPESARVAYSAVGPSGLLGVSDGDRARLALSVRSVGLPAQAPVRFVVDGASAGPLRLEVFDVGGRRVATPFEGLVFGASVTTAWDVRSQGGARCNPGIYLCRVTQPGRVAVCRVVVIR